MRFLGRSLTGVFLLFLTVGLLAWAGVTVFNAFEERGNAVGFDRPASERIFTVNVIPYEADDIAPVLSTFGEVRSRRTLELRAKASGTVVFLSDNLVEGGRVDAGETLVRVDAAEAQSALRRAQTDLAEAEAELRDARRSVELAAAELETTKAQALLRRNALERQQDLRDRGVGTETAVETAELAASAADQAVVSRERALSQEEARLELAMTRVDRQKILLEDAERELSDTEMTAAFAGTLSDVNVVEGGLLTTNEQIGILTDPDRLEVSFRISTAQYTRLIDENGDLVTAEVEAVLDASGIELTAKGQISRESGVVGEDQTGRLLFARLAAAPGFRPGDFVTVRVREPVLNEVARLPATAVDAAGRVLVLDPDNRLEEVTVAVLRKEGDDVLVKAAGLEGRDIVAARSPLLGAGIKVRPVGGAAPEQGSDDTAGVSGTITLSEARRERLVEYVKGSKDITEDARARVLSQLAQERVPAEVVNRLEARIGG